MNEDENEKIRIISYASVNASRQTTSKPNRTTSKPNNGTTKSPNIDPTYVLAQCRKQGEYINYVLYS